MRLWFLAIILILCPASSTYAAQFDTYSVVNLSYGTNRVDFDNNGTEDLVVFARRENFNAHGFDVASFYFEQPQDGDKAKALGIVTIFDKDKENFTLNVSGGADCLLNDFRLLQPKNGNQALLILATRKMSKSYYEENTVTFSYYQLENNSSGDIGFPSSYFKLSESHQAEGKYCDVSEAFRAKLGLGNYMERE